MATPNFSALLPDVTLRQIEDLKPLFNGNKTQIIIQAVKLLHQQEIQTMTPETRTATFHAKDLPAWAQHDEMTVELCRTNLAFRTKVFDAETNQMRQLLRREAHKHFEVLANT